jgi:Tol biopolymer transport system component
MQEVVVLKVGARRAIILLGVSMAMLFLASALLSTETSAQTTSPEGKIVFVKQGTEPSDKCDRQPCADLWVMDADGTNQTNLTNTPDTNEGQPAWSPDGTKIAFTGPGDLNEDGSGGLDDIYVMDADGTNQTNLTDTPDDLEYQPSWAPSGAQITFVREIPGEIISEQSDIFVMDANGQTPATPLTQTDANEREPDWSPDGTKIAFAGVRNQGWEIVTMDPNGQNEAILTGDSFDGEDRGPDWSPDSTMVVFQKSDNSGGSGGDPWEIWAVNRDGSGDTNLTNDPVDDPSLQYDDTGPSWSPDGSEITFTSTRNRTAEDPSRTDIFAMPAPTTLPPPTGQTASTTTMEQGEGAMAFAESTLLRPLTTDGISSEPDWADTPADTTPPKVLDSTTPANGATKIAPGVNIAAPFTEAMDASTTDGDASTINDTTVKLFRAGTTTVIGAVVSYDATADKAILNPKANLQRGTKYKAVVTTGATDLAGNRLDQNPRLRGLQQKAWTFTTRN